jgi:hypothetical protein
MDSAGIMDLAIIEAGAAGVLAGHTETLVGVTLAGVAASIMVGAGIMVLAGVAASVGVAALDGAVVLDGIAVSGGITVLAGVVDGIISTHILEIILHLIEVIVTHDMV